MTTLDDLITRLANAATELKESRKTDTSQQRLDLWQEFKCMAELQKSGILDMLEQGADGPPPFEEAVRGIT